MDKDIFSTKLRTLRNKKKLTQAECAQSLGIHENIYHEYENTKSTNMPSYDTMIALSLFFEVSIDYLLGLTNNPKRG